MLRRLIMAIFRLYMKYLLSRQNIHGLFIWGREGVKWARDLVVSVRKVYILPINIVVLNEYTHSTLVIS